MEIHINQTRPAWVDDELMQWIMPRCHSSNQGKTVALSQGLHKQGAARLQTYALEQFSIEIPELIALEIFALALTIGSLEDVDVVETSDECIRSYIRIIGHQTWHGKKVNTKQPSI